MATAPPRRAGSGAGRVSRTRLYPHFPSKHALFTAVHRQAADRLLAETRLDPVLGEDPTPEGPPHGSGAADRAASAP